MRTTHTYLVRLAHWVAAIAILILVLSGLDIFRAFPSFGSKLPESDGLPLPSKPGLGGWLGGALQWHFTFAWLFAAAGLAYAVELARGGWRRVWIAKEELAGIVPMIRYYLRIGPKPEQRDLYNPLQKSAYLAMIGCGAASLLSGLALAQPVQLSGLVTVFGGWQGTRLVHFVSMALIVGFIPGHLLMVAIAGKPAIYAMVVGRSPRK